MNWRLHGVIYSPFQRSYDQRREGLFQWRLRMLRAHDLCQLTDENGHRFTRRDLLPKLN